MLLIAVLQRSGVVRYARAAELFLLYYSKDSRRPYLAFLVCQFNADFNTCAMWLSSLGRPRAFLRCWCSILLAVLGHAMAPCCSWPLAAGGRACWLASQMLLLCECACLKFRMFCPCVILYVHMLLAVAAGWLAVAAAAGCCCHCCCMNVHVFNPAC